MTEKFCLETWRVRLHFCEDFTTEQKSDEFLSLLKTAEANISYDVVVELLRTFSDADDFGIQERTRNLVQISDRSLLYPALVSELNGLIARSPQKQWAVTLIGSELQYGDFASLLGYVNEASRDQRSTFLSFIGSEEFRSGHPEVERFLKAVWRTRRYS